MAALSRCPLTAEYLLSLSQTWSQFFTSLRRVQERMKDLTAAGQLHSWRYATNGQGGARLYYKLTLAGYRTVMQDDEVKPRLSEVKRLSNIASSCEACGSQGCELAKRLN